MQSKPLQEIHMSNENDTQKLEQETHRICKKCGEISPNADFKTNDPRCSCKQCKANVRTRSAARKREKRVVASKVRQEVYKSPIRRCRKCDEQRPSLEFKSSDPNCVCRGCLSAHKAHLEVAACEKRLAKRIERLSRKQSPRACVKCGYVRPFSEFRGLGTSCKPCIKIQNAQRYVSNFDKNKAYREKNREQKRIKERKKKAEETPELREARLVKRRLHHLENKELRNKQQRDRRAKDPAKARQIHKVWSSNNRERVREQSHRAKLKLAPKIKERLLTDELYRFKAKVRHITFYAFSRKNWKKTSRTQELLGVSFEDALMRLKDGYMKLYGEEPLSFEGIHLDHYIPLALCRDIGEVAFLSNINNLRALKASDNLQKADKLTYTINGVEYHVDLTPLLEFRAAQELKKIS